CMQTLRSPWTF
nr:immunoglobulin light chain junction region [Macaca mulatta]